MVSAEGQNDPIVTIVGDDPGTPKNSECFQTELEMIADL
jgi:hypothetical protein